ncbi:MAG: hypothetical protein ACRD3B_08945 [Candidatus Sulfotelmatobacter sp.]
MKLPLRSTWFVTMCLACASSLFAQQPAPPTHVEVPAIAARSLDVSTIDGVMKAFYEVISGPAGQPRQWSRDRTLYIPDIRFVAMSEDKDGNAHSHVVTHQQFVDMADPQMVKEGFHETEINRVTQSFGHIAHVFSTYETRAKSGGAVTGRGINSLELFYDGKRWWIASVCWDDERPDNPISPDYLPKR